MACRAGSFKPFGRTGHRPEPSLPGPPVVATAVRLVEEALASGLSEVLWIEDFKPEDHSTTGVLAERDGRPAVSKAAPPITRRREGYAEKTEPASSRASRRSSTTAICAGGAANKNLSSAIKLI